MQIFKFGGASVKNAEAVKNIKKIIQNSENLIVVVSAIDKTTNALEGLHKLYIENAPKKNEVFLNIKNYHFDLYKDLFQEKPDNSDLGSLFKELYSIIQTKPSGNSDFEYDKIVVYGELFSSAIIYKYLFEQGLSITHLDIRKVLITDSTHKEAKIIWEESKRKLDEYLGNFTKKIILTQGFIGFSTSGNNTTLGREGSDFTAAALAFILNTKDVVIWKDVPGIMNADPVWCNFAQKLDVLSYQEAIELAFYGAKVIHPKTIKPLENKNIPLYVKSFLNPEKEGTVIKKINHKLELPPIFILKENQTLISISPKDFSFIVEENISKIFGLFVKYNIKVNMTQNSAISFSASINSNSGNFIDLINELGKEYVVKYNENLQLITIRHYTDVAINKMISGKQIFMEQRSRITARFVVPE